MSPMGLFVAEHNKQKYLISSASSAERNKKNGGGRVGKSCFPRLRFLQTAIEREKTEVLSMRKYIKGLSVLLAAGMLFGFAACGVGESPYYTKMPLGEHQTKILFQDRCALDGISLRSNRCARLFNARKVYDPSRPVAFPFE